MCGHFKFPNPGLWTFTNFATLYLVCHDCLACGSIYWNKYGEKTVAYILHTMPVWAFLPWHPALLALVLRVIWWRRAGPSFITPRNMWLLLLLLFFWKLSMPWWSYPACNIHWSDCSDKVSEYNFVKATFMNLFIICLHFLEKFKKNWLIMWYKI